MLRLINTKFLYRVFRHMYQSRQIHANQVLVRHKKYGKSIITLTQKELYRKRVYRKTLTRYIVQFLLTLERHSNFTMYRNQPQIIRISDIIITRNLS